MDNVVSLTPPTGDPELIEQFRVMLSDAMNGRLVSFVIARVTDKGQVQAAYFYDCDAHELALSKFLAPDLLHQYVDD